MPNQTTIKDMRVNDGCRISVKAKGESSYTDIGVLKGSTSLKLQFTTAQEATANAGKTDLYIKDPSVEGSFTLKSINLDNISRMSSGLLNKVETPATAVTTIPDQTIAAGWTSGKKYELVAFASASSSVKLKLSAAPVLTSVKLDGTETLTEGDDYDIIEDADSVSGYAIVFTASEMTTPNPETKTITIDWGTNTPVARTTYTVGTSVQVIDPFSMLMTHTDSAGLVTGREIHRCYIQPGSLDFGFKGQDEEGYQEMAFSFIGVLDVTRADKDQLMSIYEDVGAE